MLLLPMFAVLAAIYARAGRFILTLICIVTGTTWAAVEKQLSTALSNLGTDSFQEAMDFGFSEALFWLATIFEDFTLLRVLTYVSIAAAIAIATLLALIACERYFSQSFARHYARLSFALLCVAIIATSVQLYYPIRSMMEQSQAFITVQRNFDSTPPPELEVNSAPLTVFVYIGESTSALNMSLYGYPRNTTPSLVRWRESEPNLLVFDNVFSTHTHTSPSLLEALSFQVIGESSKLPITERRRVSLVDVTEANGIRTVLYSNQGMSGTWNQASSIVFRRALKHFSRDSRLFGNSEHYLERPWDHQYLSNVALRDPVFGESNVSLVFFHSYAGHGSYKKNIPPAYRSATAWPMDGKSRQAVGGSSINLSNVNGYDAAISYIDTTVATALDFVKHQTKPTIMVYFADHGDAVYAGRGHDSSRFVHEMARVPFLIYFNDSARKTRRATFEKYRDLARNGNVATLAQLPSTLLDLLGASFNPEQSLLVVPEPIGTQDVKIDPILVRRVEKGISYIDLHRGAVSNPREINGADSATRHYVFARRFDRALCYGQSNSFAKALRGSFVTNCLEVDIAATPDGQISIDRPTSTGRGFGLDDLLTIPALSSSTLWLDGKDLEDPQACWALAASLINHRSRLGSALIEFSSGSMLPELKDCVTRMRMQGIRTSLAVSEDNAAGCAKKLASGALFDQEPLCGEVRQELIKALTLGFSDISFDFASLPAISAASESRNFRWNAQNFPEDRIASPEAQQFALITLQNDDPNTP